MSRTDNTVVLWWQREGSETSTSPPSHLLRLQAIHQRFHHYVLHHDFLSTLDNVISDCLSFSQDITKAVLLSHTDSSHPQELIWRLWNPPREIVSVITSALRQTTSPRDSVLVDPPPLMGTGKSEASCIKMFTSTPYLSCTVIWSLSLTPSQGSTGQDPSPPANIKYYPARLRMLHSRLARPLSLWGPQTPASQVR